MRRDKLAEYANDRTKSEVRSWVIETVRGIIKHGHAGRGLRGEVGRVLEGKFLHARLKFLCTEQNMRGNCVERKMGRKFCNTDTILLSASHPWFLFC